MNLKKTIFSALSALALFATFSCSENAGGRNPGDGNANPEMLKALHLRV